MKKLVLLLPLLSLFLICCATSSSFRNTDSVTLLLNDGEKVKAEIVDISRTRVVFNAANWREAYEYGEVLPRERITGIKLKDGSVLSVGEYEALRNDEGRTAARKAAAAKQETVDASPEVAGALSDEAQYLALKKKPISDMTENEFKFFMLMKQHEMENDRIENLTGGEANVVEPKPASAVPESHSAVIAMKGNDAAELSPAPAAAAEPGADLSQVVNSMVEAGLTARYLSYLEARAVAGDLSATESRLAKLLRKNPRWQDQIDELAFLNRTAEKALGRVFLFDPGALQSKLNLDVNPDVEMQYGDLLRQLHLALGSDVSMKNYRLLIEVFGEDAGAAVKEVLEHYDELAFVSEKRGPLATRP